MKLWIPLHHRVTPGLASSWQTCSSRWEECKIQHPIIISVLLSLCLALVPGKAAIADESLNIEDVTNDRGVKGLRATFKLNASREAVWELLTDYGRFTETFTGIRSLEVINEDDRGARVRFKIKVAFLSFDYTLQRDYVRPYELITWHRTGGDFRHLSGSWGIIPGPADGIQEIIYESFVDVGFLVPTALVRDGAAKELEQTVKRMRARLEAG